MLNTSPTAAAAILGSRLPISVRRSYHRYRHGPAAFKIDLVVADGIPWTAPECRYAATVHVGGTAEEIAWAEAQVAQAIMPDRPFVLVAQQFVADPSRSRDDRQPVWAYAHVPHGYAGDATPAVLAQLERFAPGLRERILAIHVTRPVEFHTYNPNYVGGDILTGANTPMQTLLRPRPARNPYATGVPGVYLCSAATPPGPGVHGMCGYNAARSALADLT
jgi:phytoene dehydrogenase-like protein